MLVSEILGSEMNHTVFLLGLLGFWYIAIIASKKFFVVERKYLEVLSIPLALAESQKSAQG